MRRLLPLSALLITGTIRVALAQGSCLVLGVGEWSTVQTESIWKGTRALVLLDERSEAHDGSHGLPTWHRVRWLGPGAEGGRVSDEYEGGWGWAATDDDSLAILRPAMLSEGMFIRGSWNADTLTGRAHAFSDAVWYPMQRANAYAVRFDCEIPRGRADAQAAVERLRQRDRPDAAMNAHEDSLDQAEWKRRFEREASP